MILEKTPTVLGVRDTRKYGTPPKNWAAAGQEVRGIGQESPDMQLKCCQALLVPEWPASPPSSRQGQPDGRKESRSQARTGLYMSSALPTTQFCSRSSPPLWVLPARLNYQLTTVSKEQPGQPAPHLKLYRAT